MSECELVNFPAWFEAAKDEVPDKTLIRLGDRSLTYAEANQRANQIAHALRRRGVGDGDHVLAMTRNCLQFVELLLGVPKLGAVTACVNTESRGESLRHLVDYADADIAVVHESLLGVYAAQAAELTDPPERLITIAGAPDDPDVPSSVTYEGGFRGIVDGETASRPEYDGELGPSDPQTLLHTSGTTGKPKWCQLSHNYNVRLGEELIDGFNIRRDDVIFNPLPLYHCNPQCYLLYGAIAARATAVTAERFSASSFWEQVQNAGATVLILHLAPVDILNQRSESPDSHQVRAVFPADEEFMERFGIDTGLIGFGSTEAGGLTNMRTFTLPIREDEVPEDEQLSQVTGPPRDDVDVRIFDTHDREVETGERGEIVVRPTEPHVIFDQYYNMSGATVDEFGSLWFHTGDLGYIDGEGELHFVQRISESIRVRGEFMNIEQVEQQIESHPKVMECAVVGVPAEIGEEDVKACIRTKPNADIEPASILKHCEDDLADYMIPRYIEFVGDFPRAAGTEKIQKQELEGTGRGVWDRNAASMDG